MKTRQACGRQVSGVRGRAWRSQRADCHVSSASSTAAVTLSSRKAATPQANQALMPLKQRRGSACSALSCHTVHHSKCIKSETTCLQPGKVRQACSPVQCLRVDIDCDHVRPAYMNIHIRQDTCHQQGNQTQQRPQEPGTEH